MAESEVKIKVTANTDQAKNALSGLNKSWVGLNAGIEIAQKGAQLLGDAYNVLVGDTQEYAQSVLKLTRVSGQSAEMTSRLIELTDDFGISQETLAVAMRGATTKGIAFTTDNLAALSDEYLKLPEGIQQAQFAAETFGSRAGPEMQKLLEKGSKAIRDQSASIDEHMLMTEDDLQASEDLRIAQDNLADSVTAVGRQIGKELIPPLRDAADAAYLLLTWDQKLTDAIKDQSKSLVNSKVPYKDYIEQQTQAAKQAGYFVDAQLDGVHIYRLTTAGLVEVENTLGILSRTEYEAAKEARHVTAEMQFMQTYGPGAADGIRTISDAAVDAGQKLRDDLAQGFRDVQAANEGWAKGAGGDLATMLEQADLKGGNLNQALIEVDKSMGTNYYTAKLQKEAMQKVVDEFKRTGDVDAFGDSLMRLKNGGFQAFDQQVVTARVHLQEMWAEMAKQDGQTVTVYYNVISGTGSGTLKYDSMGAGDTSYVPGDVYIPHRAGGGNVRGGSPYIVGENGPEMFVPGRSGAIVPNNQLNMGGITININGAGNPNAVARAVKLTLASYGKQYQGV